MRGGGGGCMEKSLRVGCVIREKVVPLQRIWEMSPSTICLFVVVE